jgi:hypothetical protein
VAKTRFCRKKSMQTGSSETLIGLKSRKTTDVMSLYGTEWRERGYGLILVVKAKIFLKS